MPTPQSERPEAHASGLWNYPARLLPATALLLAAGWIGLVGNLHVEEMLLGLLVVGVSTAFCALIYRSETLPINLHLHDVVQCWRVPWYVISKCTEITWLLLKDLAAHPAASLYRVCGFRGGSHDPYAIGRMSLTVAYTTAAPNFIVIGIDPHQNHMLFHQIQRTSVSKMTQALGAQQ